MNCFDQEHDHLARKHDVVVNELDGCLCVRKMATTGGSIHMENDWLWIPAYRSKSQMQVHTPGREGYLDESQRFVRNGDLSIHPTVIQLLNTVIQLNATVSELKKEIEELRGAQPRLGDSVSTTAARRLTL